MSRKVEATEIAKLLGFETITQYTLGERVAELIEDASDHMCELNKELRDLYDDEGIVRNGHSAEYAALIASRADQCRAKIDAYNVVLDLLYEYHVVNNYAE